LHLPCQKETRGGCYCVIARFIGLFKTIALPCNSFLKAPDESGNYKSIKAKPNNQAEVADKKEDVKNTADAPGEIDTK